MVAKKSVGQGASEAVAFGSDREPRRPQEGIDDKPYDMAAPSLIEKIEELAHEIELSLPEDPGAEVSRIARRLHEPLRVAVAGRVNAGKSTLVNALLRQAVAPTDVSECTKVVTWYHHGEPQRVNVVLRDGETIEMPLDPDGTLPRELPAETARVASLQVYLDNDALRRMTVIDTPGLGSLNDELSTSTEDLLRMERASYAAADAADGIAFILNQTVKEDELAIINDWSQAGQARGPQNGHPSMSAVNAIGVLTRVDTIAGVDDPLAAATKLAERQASRIGSGVATVVPVMGLLAETARTAALTERDAWHLQQFAAVDDASRERALWDVRRFLDAQLEIPVDARRRMLQRLGLFGIRYATDLIHAGAAGGAELTRQLLVASGIERVEMALSGCFLGARNDLLRARSALDALERLTYRAASEVTEPGGLRRVHGRIEHLRLEDPQMQEVAELDALHSVLVGEVELPAELRRDLELMASAGDLASRLGADGGDASQLRAAALERHARWRTFSVTEADPRQRRIARIMIRAYTRAVAGVTST